MNWMDYKDMEAKWHQEGKLIEEFTDEHFADIDDTPKNWRSCSLYLYYSALIVVLLDIPQ